ncbi:MAG: NifU N-terminal domain-containing protein [Phycisphaerales bacterium]|nr:NifU N-terminal domain-containing protein [Phycisphaerales bacterium]
MSMNLVRVESTPNPNARKLIVEPAPGSIRSYFKPEDAQDDPLAQSLFLIPEITNVLIHTKFITVCATPGTNWGSLTKQLKKTLLALNEST